MALRLVFAAAALAAAPATVAAQAAPDTLDLARAVALARANNPELAARAAEARAAALRLGPAGAWPDPTLTVGAMNYMVPSLRASADPMTMNQVTLMQTLPIGGAPNARRAAARAGSARLALLREAATLEVERRTRAAYWSVYHADRALAVMRQRLDALRDMADAVRARYAVGSAQQVDVLRAQAAVTRLGQEITEMQLERHQAATALNEALGRPAESPVLLPSKEEHAVDVAMPHGLDLPAFPSSDSLAALAEAHSPEILAAAAALDAARANHTAADRERFPDLGVGIAYGQRSRNNDMLSLMVSVSVPIFAAAKQNRVRDEAGALTDAAAHDLEAERQHVLASLVRARAEAQTARDLVRQYASTLVPQAAAGLDAALASYRVGRADIAVVLDAQTMLLDYEHDLHRFEAMYGTAVADIDRLIGRPFAEDMR
jgi:outer membrane protein TolC